MRPSRMPLYSAWRSGSSGIGHKSRGSPEGRRRWKRFGGLARPIEATAAVVAWWRNFTGARGSPAWPPSWMGCSKGWCSTAGRGSGDRWQWEKVLLLPPRRGNKVKGVSNTRQETAHPLEEKGRPGAHQRKRINGGKGEMRRRELRGKTAKCFQFSPWFLEKLLRGGTGYEARLQLDGSGGGGRRQCCGGKVRAAVQRRAAGAAQMRMRDEGSLSDRFWSGETLSRPGGLGQEATAIRRRCTA